MQEIIEKLLILQDRDRKIVRVSQELAHISPEREGMRTKAASTQNQLDAAKLRVRQIESERKQRDLEIEAKKTQIEKYLNQQLQTRKNEEYKALTHEIEMAREVIFKIEDAELFQNVIMKTHGVSDISSNPNKPFVTLCTVDFYNHTTETS